MRIEHNHSGFYTQGTVNDLMKEFPVGTVVKLLKMCDDVHPVPAGVKGVVTGVDAGGVYVDWENHSSLKLLPEIDAYEIVSRPGANEV